MRMKCAAFILRRRAAYLQRLLATNPNNNRVHGELKALTIAAECVELVMNYGFVAVTNFDEHTSQPLVAGQKPYKEHK